MQMQLVLIATLVVASRSLQWRCCTPHRSFATRRRFDHHHGAWFNQIKPLRVDSPIENVSRGYCNSRTTVTVVGASIRSSQRDHERSESIVQVFLRFSPLIGGPSVLPLHVEVILAEKDADRRSDAEDDKGTIYIRNSNDFAYLNTYPQIHRLDFLPENPTDPSTIARLISFQSVPGRLRHRYYTQHNVTSLNTSHVDRGITVLLPIGSIPCKDSNVIMSTALEFMNEMRDNVYENLRILLGKNCISFCIDLLAQLNKEYGVQRIRRWNKIDIC